MSEDSSLTVGEEFEMRDIDLYMLRKRAREGHSDYWKSCLKFIEGVWYKDFYALTINQHDWACKILNDKEWNRYRE